MKFILCFKQYKVLQRQTFGLQGSIKWVIYFALPSQCGLVSTYSIFCSLTGINGTNELIKVK